MSVDIGLAKKYIGLCLTPLDVPRGEQGSRSIEGRNTF